MVIGTLVLFWLWGRATGVGTAIGLSSTSTSASSTSSSSRSSGPSPTTSTPSPRGKRLFAVIAIGQSIGAVLGPSIAGKGADDIFVLLLVSAGIFGVCPLGSNNFINARVGRDQDLKAGGEADADKPLEKGDGFRLVLTRAICC